MRRYAGDETAEVLSLASPTSQLAQATDPSTPTNQLVRPTAVEPDLISGGRNDRGAASRAKAVVGPAPPSVVATAIPQQAQGQPAVTQVNPKHVGCNRTQRTLTTKIPGYGVLKTGSDAIDPLCWGCKSFDCARNLAVWTALKLNEGNITLLWGHLHNLLAAGPCLGDTPQKEDYTLADWDAELQLRVP
jgi:hypothetical protein